jgi:uncharacterized protein YxeA
LQQRKTCFDEEGLKLLDQRKRAKLRRLRNQSQINEDNLNNVRHETNRTFRNNCKKKCDELEAKSKNKNISYIEAKINLRRVTNLEVTY